MLWTPIALLPRSSAGAPARSGRGRRARPHIDVGFFFLFLSLLANKEAVRSRSILDLPPLSLTHGIEDEAWGWKSSWDGSYADTAWLDPWRALLRPPSLPQVCPFFFSRSLVLVTVSGAGCSSLLLHDSPWQRGLERGGFEGSFLNKLTLCPDLEELQHPVLSSGHHGGGSIDWRGWSAGVHCLGIGSSPPVLSMELWRLLRCFTVSSHCQLSPSRRRPCISS